MHEIFVLQILFSASPKNDPDVNKRPVRVGQPGAHSREIVPLFNSYFSGVY
jgi:hypothetical protein